MKLINLLSQVKAVKRKRKRVIGKDHVKEFDVMNKYYLNLKKNKELVCVYSDTTDPESFSAGYITGVTDENMIIFHLTPKGKYDGYILLSIDNIFLMEYNTKYSKKLQKISDSLLNNDIVYFESDDLKLSLLEYARENNFIIEVQLINSGINDVIGKVAIVEDGLVKIDRYNEYGESDGQAVFNISNITRLVCDSEEDQILNEII